MSRKYLVTGAAGFLGSTVCRQLVEEGADVRAFVLPNDPAAKYIPESVEVVEGDLCDKKSLEPFFAVEEGVHTVVLHVASMVTTNAAYSKKLVDVNVGGTKNIIAKCLEHKECDKLVYVSSTGAIPEAPKGRKIREVKKFDPDQVVGWYSRTKAMATQAVLDAVTEKGLNACVVHPSGILGPNDFSISETTGTIIRIINGDMPMGMEGSFNLCDVRDLADGVIAAADKGMAGECYILGNEEVTMRQLSDMIASETGCTPIKHFLPLPVAKGIAKIAEKTAGISGKKPVMTAFAVYNLERNNTFDYSKAKKVLGYHTRPYTETVCDEVQWLQQEGKIKTA